MSFVAQPFARLSRWPAAGASVAALATFAFCLSWAGRAAGQATPDWGAKPSPGRSMQPAAASSAAPWGGNAAGARPTGAQKAASPAAEAGTAIPPAIAELLKRPDTDVIALSNGQHLTVKQIRAGAAARSSIAVALKTGKLPVGRQRIRLASAKVAQHDELLAASKVLRDSSRVEAAATWGQEADAPTVQSGGAILGPEHAGPTSARQLRAGDASRLQVSQKPSQLAVEQLMPPGITSVNKHGKGVQFTPGGLYTVIGSGFGAGLGTVALVGRQLPGGQLALPVTQWNEHQVQAQFPEPLSGVADQPVTLRVTTRTGTSYTFDAQFFATRQPLVIGALDVDVGKLFSVTYGNPGDWVASPNGLDIARTKSGNDINCPAVGQDSLRSELPAGWTLVDLTVSSWLPTQGDSKHDLFGGDGDTVVSGNYAVEWVPAGLTSQMFVVHWGVMRSHSTSGFQLLPKTNFTGNDLGWSGNDGCASLYELQVTVVGPAGLRPF